MKTDHSKNIFICSLIYCFYSTEEKSEKSKKINKIQIFRNFSIDYFINCKFSDFISLNFQLFFGNSRFFLVKKIGY